MKPRKRKQSDKDLQELNKKLGGQEFSGKVMKKVTLNRQNNLIAERITILEAMEKNANGKKLVQIKKELKTLRKVLEIGNTAFYKK